MKNAEKTTREENVKRGIYIGRFQPFHNGHLSVVRAMDSAPDLDELVIGIGTSQVGHIAYNPFTAEERKMMIDASLTKAEDPVKPYSVVYIPDINDYPRWVGHVESLTPRFEVVYSGNTIVKELFEEKGYEVRPIEMKIDISATRVREMMIRGEDWKRFVPEGACQVIDGLGGEQRLRGIVSRYNQVSVTADVIVNYKDQGIVYIRRKHEPFKGEWALPGGHAEPDEPIEATAARELMEETNLEVPVDRLKLLGVYSTPGRDPRGPYHTTVFYTSVDKGELKAKDDALEIKVFQETPPKLAFDHHKIMKDYYKARHKGS
ncbi:nicotinamide-nucleotide adenylyltransferase [Candidatus Woesearchaeota archaeon]|nr:nicotinamide-nucleotide adenylyltransferase [Candidatus Woesearchaeota archaeon]